MPVSRASTKNSKVRTDQELSVDDVVEKIYGAIFSHLLHPGTKLGEDRLATIFGTSRSKVREALARLANDQVVELIPQRGAYVARPSIEKANDVFEARRLIEPGILHRLVANPTPKISSALRAHQRKEKDARRAKDDRTILRLSGEFHLLLAELAGNDVLTRSMRELTTITCLIISLYDAPTSSCCREDEHANIIGAIIEGNENRAVTLMLEHLEDIRSNLNLRRDAPVIELEAVFGAI
ncbi:MAG: GntR family transcriptional regulator [Rhizobiales bacterium]|nr:GntR family transcriptional regulator [Hyphomicrobiales bacterium]